jgi:hypothetical protein
MRIIREKRPAAWGNKVRFGVVFFPSGENPYYVCCYCWKELAAMAESARPFREKSKVCGVKEALGKQQKTCFIQLFAPVSIVLRPA